MPIRVSAIPAFVISSARQNLAVIRSTPQLPGKRLRIPNAATSFAPIPGSGNSPVRLMKKITTSLLFLVGALFAASSLAAQPAPAAKMASTGGNSPHETFGVVLGDRRTGNRVTITYGRPFSKDPKTGQMRAVWGKLVPWEKAYRLGSDEATLLITQQPLMIGDAKVPAGAYTLYLVPSESGATKLAISTNIGKWGIPVDETKDLARVELKKTALENSVDQLTLAIEKDQAAGGVLKISWEKTQFSIMIATVK